MGSFFLMVLWVFATFNVDTGYAACGALPIDGNADAPQLKAADREDTDSMTYKCKPGYEVNDESGDKTYIRTCGTDTWGPTITATFCEDTDECGDDSNICGTGYCVNVPGSYVCVCDASSLHDDNDCGDYQCGAPPVDGNAMRGEAGLDPDDTVSYKCRPGFGVGGSATDLDYDLDCDGESGSWGSISTYCDDINECDTEGMCGEDNDASCRNTYGSYICVCDYPGAADGTGVCVEEGCGTSPMYPNAYLSENTFEEGEVLDYKCADGFVTESGGQDFSLICSKGNWAQNSDDEVCSDRNECGDGIDNCDSNAECINGHGSYLCRCHLGFTGNGFSGNCDRVPCDTLPDIPNAAPTLALPASPEYEDKVVYACDTGYEVSILDGLNSNLKTLYEFTSNSFMVECLHTGRWSSWPMPHCQPVSCGDPGEVANATRTGGKFTYNMDVTYTCNKGYRLKSHVADPQQFTITCGSDGDWDLLQKCVDIDECTELSDLCNRESNADCINIPSSYICRCRAGFTGDGRTCTRIPCNPLPVIADTTGNPVALPNPVYEDEVTYECNAGYQVWLYGAPSYLLGYYTYTSVTTFTMVCTANGLWSPWPHPVCVQVKCEPLPSLPHAEPTSGVKKTFLYGDDIIYTCEKGYHVLQQAPYSSILPVYYGYSQKATFSVKCSKKGQWDPFPIPACVPLNCGDPGVVLYATRAGGDFTYGKTVHHKCTDGFRPKNTDLGTTGFSQTCREDGTWSKGTECVDIDECEENHNICGKGVYYCLNTKGSYVCSCVPWYIKNPDDTSCVDWAGLASFPVYKPCEIVETLRLCIHGVCALQDGQAICRCDSGWKGIGCDVRIIGPALIVAIVALVITAFLLFATCVFYTCRIPYLHRHTTVCAPPPSYSKPCNPKLPPPPPPQTMRFPRRFPAWSTDTCKGLRRTDEKRVAF